LPHTIAMGSLIWPKIVNFLTKKGSGFYVVIFSLLQPLAILDGYCSYTAFLSTSNISVSVSRIGLPFMLLAFLELAIMAEKSDS